MSRKFGEKYNLEVLCTDDRIMLCFQLAHAKAQRLIVFKMVTEVRVPYMEGMC